MTVAALYVETNGAYFGLPDVDPWDVERDARNYLGPHPVVAHPPCNWWAMPLAKVNRTRYGHAIGRDGGMFAHALWSVRTFGGVLEHPAGSAAWDFFGIPIPQPGSWQEWAHGWRWDANRAWVTRVSQVAYGHQLQKRTWLLYSGTQAPPELDWSEPAHTAVTSWLQRTNTTLPRLTKKAAGRTPKPFRTLMLTLARRSGGLG